MILCSVCVVLCCTVLCCVVLCRAVVWHAMKCHAMRGVHNDIHFNCLTFTWFLSMRFHSFAKIGVEMKFECKLHKILALHSLQLQQRLVSTNSFIYLECKKDGTSLRFFSVLDFELNESEWSWAHRTLEHFECILFSFSICISFERRNSLWQNASWIHVKCAPNTMLYDIKWLFLFIQNSLCISVFLFFTFSVCFTWCSASISIASIFRIVRFHFSGTLNVMATGFYVFININLSVFSHLCLSILAHWNCFGKYFLEMSFNEQMDIQQILDIQFLYISWGFSFYFFVQTKFQEKIPKFLEMPY